MLTSRSLTFPVQGLFTTHFYYKHNKVRFNPLFDVFNPAQTSLVKI